MGTKFNDYGSKQVVLGGVGEGAIWSKYNTWNSQRIQRKNSEDRVSLYNTIEYLQGLASTLIWNHSRRCCPVPDCHEQWHVIISLAAILWQHLSLAPCGSGPHREAQQIPFSLLVINQTLDQGFIPFLSNLKQHLPPHCPQSYKYISTLSLITIVMF